MNILLSIHHEMNKNAGAPGVTYQLYKQYQRLGHHAVLFSFDDLPSYVPGKWKGIVFPYFLFRRIRQLARAGQLDVVDASSGDAWLWALLRSRRHSPALVSRSHGLEHTMHENLLEEQRRGHVKLSWKYPLYHGGLRLQEVAISFRRADGALFLNHRDFEYAVSRLKVKSPFARVVRNGLPDEFLQLPIVFQKEKEIRIAQIGSYIPRKGILYTAQALDGILREYPHVKMSFIGTGCSRETVLRDYAEALHGQIEVVSEYSHEELPSLLADHHIKLFPTLSEGFPLSLIEAMACGLAPVTSFTTGSFLVDGRDALIVPFRDSTAIQSKLRQLIEDPDYLLAVRKKAYETAQQHEWNRIAGEAIAFYEQLKEVNL
ncbi:glycosyltransferase family 4 protein [Paenibacillus sp. NPDC058174]|uniref:glycosyltransferase family 4 protein n=1 Tax=Paenibacillus sp. NPDC058174 TaxID=3346366 RepID=UPI0036DEA014